MVRRTAELIVAIALAVTVTPPGAAHAEPYPAGPPPASVSDGTVPDGGTITFSGSGFLPFEKISIAIDYAGADSAATHREAPAGGFVLASVRQLRRAGLTVTADAKGSFSITLKLTQVGAATLVATGLTSGRTVTAHVQVLAPSDGAHKNPAPGDDGAGRDDVVALPTTGQSAAPLLIAVCGGTGLVVLGAAVLWLARSRRRESRAGR